NRTLRRRTMLAVSAQAAIAAGLAACGGNGDDDDATATQTASPTPATNTPEASPSPTAPPATASPTTPASSPTPEAPSLEEMVGQMLMLGFRGTELTADNPIVADIRDRHVGGVILFSYDVPSDSPERNIA